MSRIFAGSCRGRERSLQSAAPEAARSSAYKPCAHCPRRFFPGRCGNRVSEGLSINFFFLFFCCRRAAAPRRLRYQPFFVLDFFIYELHCSCRVLLAISLFHILLVGFVCRFVSGCCPVFEILVRPLEIYVVGYLNLYDRTLPFLLVSDVIFEQLDVVFTHCRGEQLT